MNRTPLNVIDLDHTLIPFDSLRTYTFRFLFSWRCFFPIAIVIALRVLKLRSQQQFLKDVVLITRKHPNHASICKEVAEKVIANINPDIFQEVLSYSKENTINVLCTASPKEYTALVAIHLGWELLSSEVTAESTLHLYGNNKIIAVREKYPETSYFYNYSISDSTSDLALLHLFNTHKLLR